MKNSLSEAASNIYKDIRNFLREIKFKLLDDYAFRTYSQEGEDMILRRIFEGKEKGFYVDVGAHHPKRFSNTYFFYKKQKWSGINIDATPGSMVLFRKVRYRDINIEAAIAQENKDLTFFMFNEPGLNSFDEQLAYERIKDNNYKIIGKQKLPTKTLREILTTYLPPNQKLDFLSVDVEGLDLEVLQSNDWQRFRPEYVLVECLGLLSVEEVINTETYQFLLSKNYQLFAKTAQTVIFREKKPPHIRL